MPVRRLAPWLLFVSALLRADDYADLFRQAADYSKQGKYEEAISRYKAALAIRPGAPEALNNLAVMEYEAGHYADAFDISSKIWPQHPKLKSAALIAGMAAVQCNRPRDALAPFERVLSADPVNRDALLGLASAHMGLNELPEAVETYERETAHSATDATAWYGLAICYERLAEDASKELAQMPGGFSYSKRLLSEYLQGLGDERLAAKAFGDAEANVATASPDADRQYQRAHSLADKSRSAFDQFVKLAPDSWQAAVFSGDVDRQHGNLVSALNHYRTAAEKQPKNAAPLLGLGTVYWEMGDFDRASRYLRETLELNPRAMQALFELANIALRRHQETDAIPLLKQYLAVQPDASAARADLGRAYLHLQQYQKAAEELSRAAETDARGDIHHQLSVALRKLGREEQANAALKRSRELRAAQLEREQRSHAVR